MFKSLTIEMEPFMPEIKLMEGSLIVRTNPENNDWIQIYNSQDDPKDSLTIPKDEEILDDLIEALTLMRKH